MKFDGPKTALIFVNSVWILSYWQWLNDYNFIRNLPKVAKKHFLESAPECLRMCQESISHHNPVGNKMTLKFWKKSLFCRRFSQKVKTLKS